MKNNIKTLFTFLMATLLFASCDPQDKHDLGLGTEIATDEVDFLVEVSSESNNVINFTKNSKHVGVVTWNLGNEKSGKGDITKGTYPYKGEYTVTMTLYTSGGAIAVSKIIPIAQNDFSLIDSETYRNLTGGIDNTEGKVWVFDQHNLYIEEVAKGSGMPIKGHMGLGALNSGTQEYWAANANDKASWTLYDHKFTFKQAGTIFNIQNKEKGYGRAASTASVGGFPNVTSIGGDDVIFDSEGGDLTFSIDEDGEFPVLRLSKLGYMGYYCGSQDHDIVYQTDKVMALRVKNTEEGQDWIFVYILQELNIAPPAPEIPLKAYEINEDFENDKPSIEFVTEEMGAKFSLSFSNPAQVPINESDKVVRYEKSGEHFYTNVSHTAAGIKFDLTTNNKIRLKAFIPSYNDYTTVHEVAGSWITVNQLQKQIIVKLQDSSKGGDAWETQVEVVKADLDLNQWIELEFDFSAFKDRKDFNKIVIQFGAEGHKAPGLFYFDDLTFSK